MSPAYQPAGSGPVPCTLNGDIPNITRGNNNSGRTRLGWLPIVVITFLAFGPGAYHPAPRLACPQKLSGTANRIAYFVLATLCTLSLKTRRRDSKSYGGTSVQDLTLMRRVEIDACSARDNNKGPVPFHHLAAPGQESQVGFHG